MGPPDRLTTGYPAIITSVVQPRVDGLDACKHTMTEIRQQIKQAGGIDQLKDFLTKIEPLFMPDGPYIFGSRVCITINICKSELTSLPIDDLGRLFPLSSDRGLDDGTREHVHQHASSKMGKGYGVRQGRKADLPGYLGRSWSSMIRFYLHPIPHP